MAKFRTEDVRSIELDQTSPTALRTKIGEMIMHSTVTRAKVDALNPETGEYRVVLQGTLSKEDLKREN
jgi:hypothetical protein